MANNIFTDIAAGKPAFLGPDRIIAARDWFRQEAQRITDVDPRTLLKQMQMSLIRDINISSIGSMFLYQYDPKYKDRLPYYDTWPLIFVVDVDAGGWSGLNLHYLPPAGRAALMNALYGITIKEKDRMKIQLSYNILKSTRSFKQFGPCYKKYLTSHVRSRILFIEPSKWDTAMMLPTARFQKASPEQVWNDTRNQR